MPGRDHGGLTLLLQGSGQSLSRLLRIQWHQCQRNIESWVQVRKRQETATQSAALQKYTAMQQCTTPSSKIIQTVRCPSGHLHRKRCQSNALPSNTHPHAKLIPNSKHRRAPKFSETSWKTQPLQQCQAQIHSELDSACSPNFLQAFCPLTPASGCHQNLAPLWHKDSAKWRSNSDMSVSRTSPAALQGQSPLPSRAWRVQPVDQGP